MLPHRAFWLSDEVCWGVMFADGAFGVIFTDGAVGVTFADGAVGVIFTDGAFGVIFTGGAFGFGNFIGAAPENTLPPLSEQFYSHKP